MSEDEKNINNDNSINKINNNTTSKRHKRKQLIQEEEFEIHSIENDNELTSKNHVDINNNLNLNNNNTYNSNQNLSLSYLQAEKENLLASLRKDMKYNEDQRNYIEILKNAINNNELQNGNTLNKDINNNTQENRQVKLLKDEIEKLKFQLNEYKSKNLETKYRDLLLDYEKIQEHSNENILQNEELKKLNEDLEKETNNLKNKNNSLLKELKKTKLQLEDISIKYNLTMSYKDEVGRQKVTINELKDQLSKYQSNTGEKSILIQNSGANDKKIEILENEIENLKEQLSINASEKIEIGKTYNELFSEFSKLKNEYDLLNKNYIKKNDEYNKIQNLNINFQKEVDELKNNSNSKAQIKNDYENNIINLNKQIESLNADIEKLNNKISENEIENTKLNEINNELLDKYKLKISDQEKIALEMENTKKQYDLLSKKFNDTIVQYQTKINAMNELFLNNNNNSHLNELQIQLEKCLKEKNKLISIINEILIENKDLSETYQKHLKLLQKNNIKINSESLKEFITDCSNDLVLLQNKNNEYDSVNEELAKIKNERKQIEIYSDKLNNDKQYVLTILLRLCKIFTNSSIFKLVNEIMNNKNLTIDEKEDINKKVLIEIKKCGEYFKELKNKNLEIEFSKRRSDFNYMRDDNNTNNYKSCLYEKYDYKILNNDKSISEENNIDGKFEDINIKDIK